MNTSRVYENENQTNNQLSFNGKINITDFSLGTVKVFNFNSIKISVLPIFKKMRFDIYFYPNCKVGKGNSGNFADSIVDYSRDPNHSLYWNNFDKHRKDIFVNDITYTPKFTFTLEGGAYGFFQYPILGELIEIRVTPLENDDSAFVFTSETQNFNLYLNTLLCNTTSEINENIF